MKNRYIEDIVQTTIVNWLRLNRFLFTSTGAGLIKNRKTQIIMNRLGYTGGTPDIIVFIPNGTVGIECKKPATYKYSEKSNKMIVDSSAGRQSLKQYGFEEKLTSIKGHYYMVATSVFDVIDFFNKNEIKPI